jgi:plasmid stabilization system protein ParE
MVTIRWNKKARRLFREHIVYARLEFGETVALSWYKQMHKIEDRLSKHPESFKPEPLVVKSHIYRRAIIMRRFKIIHFYIPSSNTVRIVDIWDMRMNPETLKKRIR